MLTQTMRDLFAKFTTTEDSTSERFGSTGAYIHVGSGTATENSNQNSLSGFNGSSGGIKAMSAGYPKRNDLTDSTGPNILAFRSLFATNEAVYDWNEWMIKNTTASASGVGTAFNRKQEALGTKPNTQSWQLTALLTLTT